MRRESRSSSTLFFLTQVVICHRRLASAHWPEEERMCKEGGPRIIQFCQNVSIRVPLSCLSVCVVSVLVLVAAAALPSMSLSPPTFFVIGIVIVIMQRPVR
ncbi:uncharacterized protein GGS25DRAFT_492831 [Hypoxylon fragiforme]|uniref:uncharacterized protein n=1 Tax=Hypoxylon fragiforme TaxID=63214 RepID=UPI0020C732A9|nr:uncharacterized protein GGS25DRAFT_492831 [Hypoxylon fragiforme]KAI2609058.1 hypothetical protein GGS25DRAFT_492831 [Hypoxylon fragiforme]